MTDNLVKRLNTPWDTDHSIISQTDKWMRERKEAAERIEELEAQSQNDGEEILHLRFLVELSVGALHYIGNKSRVVDFSADQLRQHARMTIAALKGEANG